MLCLGVSRKTDPDQSSLPDQRPYFDLPIPVSGPPFSGRDQGNRNPKDKRNRNPPLLAIGGKPESDGGEEEEWPGSGGTRLADKESPPARFRHDPNVGESQGLINRPIGPPGHPRYRFGEAQHQERLGSGSGLRSSNSQDADEASDEAS
jgi:hypothetical protein